MVAAKLRLHKQQVNIDMTLYGRRQYYTTEQGVRTFQSTYRWRSLEDEAKVFLITIAIFPGRTIGRIAVFSIDASKWCFLHDCFGENMEAAKLERLKDIDPDDASVLEKIEADEKELLTYAKMLFGVEV